MKRLALFGYGLALSAATACTVDQNNALYILQNQALDPGAACSVPGTATAAARSNGILDLTSPIPGTNLGNPGYIFTPLVVNGAAINAHDPSQHIVFLQGADIQLQSSTSMRSQQVIASLVSSGLDKRTQRFSATIKPSSSAGVPYPLIDFDQAQALGTLVQSGEQVQIIAHTTVFGTSDGGSVVSAPTDYPITLCRGCLWTIAGTCGALPAGTTVHKGGACNLLENDLLTCCTTGSATQCPATM